jgi:hypothetical protein
MSLADGVANMAVNPQGVGGQPTRSHLEKVSGLDSFVESSDDSEGMLGKTIQEIKEARGSKESLSINDRTLRTKGERVQQSLAKRTHMRGHGGAMKDTEKRTKKT